MGKNKTGKTKESKRQAEKTGQNLSKKKIKGDGKPKKTTQEDHLQHIPFRLREIMKSKDKMKNESLGGKKLKKALSLQSKPNDALDGDIAVPRFRKGKTESVGAYVRRMENETQHVLFLTNNQVERKPELEPDKQEKAAAKGKSEKKKEYAKMRLSKLQQKKLDKQEDKIEKELFVDNVPFGEVSMAPPSLGTKPKKAPVKTQASKELLLNSLLGHSMASTAKPSMARQRMMEEERQRAVEAYRLLKKQKQQEQQTRNASLGKLLNLE
ncbi:PREDICTED: coiled-coil domain-containing protein 137 [Poecilia mexicana]|uniref:Coiled-coil domain containing 137 n=1 Tax=Poecilia mexicana TaxID=48701 RepID=A0A3B3XN66_9TELE|nr:PREDICTED: coiled-coil domain-containing protein 137 [Poecilia formosa]XP_014833137.1 PREDICTED: coiled-coil domain-containing protein 137 [Poecilia mexicana]